MPYFERHEVLLEGEVGTGASKPVLVADMVKSSLHFVGLGAGDAFQIQGSNEKEPENWVDLGNAVEDDDAIITIEDAPRWIRVNKSAASTDPTTVIYQGYTF